MTYRRAHPGQRRPAQFGHPVSRAVPQHPEAEAPDSQFWHPRDGEPDVVTALAQLSPSVDTQQPGCVYLKVPEMISDVVDLGLAYVPGEARQTVVFHLIGEQNGDQLNDAWYRFEVEELIPLCEEILNICRVVRAVGLCASCQAARGEAEQPHRQAG